MDEIEEQSREDSRKQQLEADGAEQQLQLRRPRLQPGAEEKLVLQFLDSMHSYLTLFDALSSTLRQGWLDLASARHSMGGLRINSSLLDMKLHSAATSVEITQYDAVDSIATQPCFILRKWASSDHGNSQLEDKDVQLQESSSKLQSSAEENAEMTVVKDLSGLTDNDQVQKERSKSLSVFGILISPKLRASQLTFERALEMLVEIANMQSSLLYSFYHLREEVEDNKR